MRRLLAFYISLLVILSFAILPVGAAGTVTDIQQPLKDITAVAASGENTYALDSDGDVWGWGDSQARQLGEGVSKDQYNSFSPAVILGLNNIKSISAGRSYLLCVTNDGYVVGLGNNTSAQTRVRSNDNVTTIPTKIEGLSKITEVSAGDEYAMALKEDGTIWIWGSYKYNSNRKAPAQIERLSDITKVFAFKNDAYAIDKKGNVFQSRGTRNEPYELTYLEKIVDLMECRDKLIALKSDGTVWMVNVLSGEVKQVAGMNNIASLAGSSDSGIIAVDKEGALWTGDSQGNNVKKSSEIGDVKAVAAGKAHYAVLKNDGTVWTWGENKSGQLGNGAGFYGSIPIKVEKLTGVRSAVATRAYSLILKQDGTVWSFGSNEHGQLGDGTKLDKYEPVQVQGLSEVDKIAASVTHGMALKKDGTIWAWGSNESGALGNGTFDESLIPVQVKGLTDAKDIAVGNQFSAALRKNSTLWIWGNMPYGLKKGEYYGNKSLPVQVTEIYGVKAISAGYDHLLALRSDGTVWVLGNDSSGQYGRALTSTELEKIKPIKVAGLADINMMSAGYDFNLVKKTFGNIISWGRNKHGQLGVLYQDNVYSRFDLKETEDIVSISAGSNHSFAIREDGSLLAWGNNTSGQLGIGSNVGSFTPVKNKNISDVKYISAGDNYTIAVKKDGTVWVWGDNRFGQLGLGYKVSDKVEKPIQVMTK